METKKEKNTIFFHFELEKYGFSEYFIQQAIEHSTCTIKWMLVSIDSLLNDKMHHCAGAFAKMKQTNERTTILGYISMRKNQFDIALLDHKFQCAALIRRNSLNYWKHHIFFFNFHLFLDWNHFWVDKKKKTKNNFRDQKFKKKSKMKEKILVGKQGLHN